MELFVRRAGATGEGHLKYRFTTVFVSSVSPSGDGEEMRERVTFAYGSVAQSYTQQTTAGGNPAGTVFSAGWSQIGNIPCIYGSCEKQTVPCPKRCESRNSPPARRVLVEPGPAPPGSFRPRRSSGGGGGALGSTFEHRASSRPGDEPVLRSETGQAPRRLIGHPPGPRSPAITGPPSADSRGPRARSRPFPRQRTATARLAQARRTPT